ncbi:MULTISPECIES: AAA family ATPase [Methylobacterium]|uniref:Kinase n=1 Tax=Methylobacterium ajmalii TaxID=2738439 RepID=A0ABU9ZR41_9HYPH|nr:AAA family ATPase [Methylobacterium aquaticum]
MRPAAINPDDCLETEEGRVWTPERSRQAWQACYETLRRALRADDGPRTVVIVCGLQGAGKTTWIGRQARHPEVVYFDAALPGARHRRPIVEIARSAGARLEAVWIDVPLALALTRNASRPADRRVPEEAIRSVAGLFEAPTAAEGFDRITVVRPGAAPDL